MEVPATPTVLSTPTLPPTNPKVVPPTQNTVSPVRFHTPNASPPNPPEKDDGDDDDKASNSDSESAELLARKPRSVQEHYCNSLTGQLDEQGNDL